MSQIRANRIRLPNMGKGPMIRSELPTLPVTPLLWPKRLSLAWVLVKRALFAPAENLQVIRQVVKFDD